MDTEIRNSALAHAIVHARDVGEKEVEGVVAIAERFAKFIQSEAVAIVGAVTGKGKGKGKSADTAATPAGSTPSPNSAPADAAPASAKVASDPALDDLFGEGEKAVTKEVKTTLDDVRAALVKVQTAKKSKDAAIAILKEVAGEPVLSALKEKDYGTLVAKCEAAAKAA